MSELMCPSYNREMASDFMYCPYCGSDLMRSIACPKCGYENEANSKYCQECGSVIGKEATSTSTTPKAARMPEQDTEVEPPPKDGICIEFPFTSAQSFDFALKEARKLPGFVQFGQDKKAIYRVLVQPSEISSVTDLLEQLKGWRKRTVYLNGDKVQWDSVFSYSWCIGKKDSSYKPEFYCFGYENDYDINVWGCIQAHMPFHENAEWFCWGNWIGNRGNWKFDKERMKHELEKALYNYRFCQALKTDKIEAVIVAIPETVNPAKDMNWKFVEDYGNESGSGLVVAVDRFGMKEKVSMKGVCPNGQGVIREIAKKLQLTLPIN